jgi:anti-sigma regulatory factor (Ser/Thr protein kinase)
MRSFVRNWLCSVGASEDEVQDVVVAHGEACTNAVKHAGGREVVLGRQLLLGNVIRLSVRDFGHWRIGPTTAAADLTGGRGLSMARGLMDDLAIRRYRDGTEIVLYRRLSSRRAAVH